LPSSAPKKPRGNVTTAIIKIAAGDQPVDRPIDRHPVITLAHG